jgi:hypothetical protein
VDLEEELNRVRKELIDATKAKEDALAEAHSQKLSVEFTEQECDVRPSSLRCVFFVIPFFYTSLG